MIDLNYRTRPNGHKIALFLGKTGFPCRIVPVDIGKGEQFTRDFLAIAQQPYSRNHGAHILIGGAVSSAERPDPADSPDSTLDPGAIGEIFLAVIAHPRSARSWKIEPRPWVESF